MGPTIARLKHELGASPKKAAALGLLLLVAMYYWAPLAYRFVAPAKVINEKAQALAAQSNTAPADDAAAGLKNGPAETNSWQQLAKAMSADAQMTSVAAISLDRDPFAVPARAAVAENAPVAAKEQPVVGPEDVNLVLSSTIVGSRRSIAIINGKTFRPGDTIKASTEDEEVAFRILEIHHRDVVLERDGRKFELKIPVKLAASDVLGAPVDEALDGLDHMDKQGAHSSDDSRDVAPPVSSQPN